LTVSADGGTNVEPAIFQYFSEINGDCLIIPNWMRRRLSIFLMKSTR